MRIEQIKRSRRKQERILVTLEDGSVLRVTEEELLHFGLHKGMDLSPALVIKCQGLADASAVRAQAAAAIGRRAMSKGELTRRLADKGATTQQALEAADWLESIGAMDDAHYALQVVAHYARAGYGAGRIREELRRRQIPRACWEEALSHRPESAETIRTWVTQRLRGRTPDEKEYKRISDALLRRGFSWSEIQPVLRELGAQAEE